MKEAKECKVNQAHGPGWPCALAHEQINMVANAHARPAIDPCVTSSTSSFLPVLSVVNLTRNQSKYSKYSSE